MEYAIEFDRLVKLRWRGRSDDGGRRTVVRGGVPARAPRRPRRPALRLFDRAHVEATVADRRRTRLAPRGPPRGARGVRGATVERTACTRRTSTCGDVASMTPRRLPRSPRCRRTAGSRATSRAGSRSARPASPRAPSTRPSALRRPPRDPVRARRRGRGPRPRAARRGSAPARGERLAELSRARGPMGHSSTSRRRPRGPSDRVRWTLGAPRTLIGRTLVVLEDGAEAPVVEEFVERRQVDRGRPGPVGDHRAPPRDRPKLAMASLQEPGPDHIVFQQRPGRHRQRRGPPLGPRPARRPLVRSGSTTSSPGRENRRAGEIVFGADEQVHDLTSHTRHGAPTRPASCSRRGSCGQGSQLHEGPDPDREDGDRDQQLPRRVRMNLSRAARAVAIPSLEIDQPDCRRRCRSSRSGRSTRPAVLPRDPRDRAPGGPQVHRPRVPGARRGARPARGGAGPAAGRAGGQVVRRLVPGTPRGTAAA